ncbi:hypothetical protein DB346_03825 [Verrucomicrobia bacterium LW23]|nr:hypothetical protein DB346_03825 [Verrucomicrobia bacterium LW23]
MKSMESTGRLYLAPKQLPSNRSLAQMSRLGVPAHKAMRMSRAERRQHVRDSRGYSDMEKQRAKRARDKVSQRLAALMHARDTTHPI